MPPKTKAKKKKTSARAKSPTMIDGVSAQDLTEEQLEEHIVHLREELNRVREERNYFQLERDQIQSFRQVTERELEEAQAQLRNLEKDTEEAEERHQAELKVYRQKMKHLLCEEQSAVCELQAQAADAAGHTRQQQVALEEELCEQMGALQTGVLQDDSLARLQEKQRREAAEVAAACERQLRDVQEHNRKKLEMLQQDLENMRKVEICEFEDRSNRHISSLMEDHQEALSSLRSTWNDILRKDVAEMSSLQKETAEKKAKLEADKRRLAEALHSQKMLSQKVEEVEREVAKHQKKLHRQETDKKLLAKTQALLKMKEKTLEERRRERDELRMKLSQVQQERDQLLQTFPDRVQLLQQQAELKSSRVEVQVEVLSQALDQQRAQLHAATAASSVDADTLSRLARTAQEAVVSRNSTIQHLRHQVAQVRQANDALLLFMEEKLRPFGVPVEQLGFGSCPDRPGSEG